ncbi:hypothetical protein BDN67DRAFT_875878, partial [Paxillus ammoniavirescens]
LQCAIPVFTGFFPEPHNHHIIKLLFVLGHWHGLAKLRLHTDETLDILDAVTKNLGDLLRKFIAETCPAFSTKELRREAECHRRQQAHGSAGGAPQSQGINVNNCRAKALNLRTYKFHALSDDASQIRLYGTTDSYSTQLGELEHCTSKS